MDINDIFTKGLNLDNALDLLWPVSIYILGMSAYAIFVFKFYRFVATRDIFEMDLTRYEESSHRLVRSVLYIILYVFKYLILFPVFAFFWFAVLTLILAFLSKGQTFPETLLIALATVSAIRVTAYYSEDLSRDLAKILPFAVLGIFLVDASFFSVWDSLNSLKVAGDYSENILYYLLFLIALEFVLRLLMGALKLIAGIRKRMRKRHDSVAESGSTPLTGEAAFQEDINRMPPEDPEKPDQGPDLPQNEQPQPR